MADEVTEPMTARERVIARYGWPLPAMAGAEEPAGDDGGGDAGSAAGADDGQGAGGETSGGAGGSQGAGDDVGGDDGRPFDKARALDTIRRQRESEATALDRAKRAEAKLKEIEDAGKSDAQRRDEELTSTKTENGSLKSENARLKVALDLGLTLAQAKRLVGDTEEELKADAEQLLKDFGGSKKDEGGKRRPKENLKPGTVPDAEPEETDPAKLAAGVPRAW